MKSPQDRDSGFTLLEMLAVLIVAGILVGMAAPSLLSLNKPLRDGVSQFTSHINLIRSKAMASSQAYRIKPKYTNVSQYPNPKNYPNPIANKFIVEYSLNCQVPDTGFTDSNGNLIMWQVASQFDLDLPQDAGITSDTSITLPNPSGTTPTTETIANANDLNWNICFDTRGIIYQTRNLVFRDFQGNNKAKLAKIELNKVGVNDVKTYDVNIKFISNGSNVIY